MTSNPSTPWDRAKLALTLLAVDPRGLGGIWLRCRAGVVRDRFVAALGPIFADCGLRRIHPGISDDQLFGGIDLAATLESGRQVLTSGIIDDNGSALMLSMAERADAQLAARIGQALDRSGHTLIALDEGVEDEGLATSVAMRLAFHLNLDDVSFRDAPEIDLDADRLETARLASKDITVSSEDFERITSVAAQFGVDDSRAISFVIRAARALSAIKRENVITNETLCDVAQLVLGPRARHAPDIAEPMPETQAESSDLETKSAQNTDTVPQDILLEAIAASLPKDVLAKLQVASRAPAKSSGSGAGERQRGNRRGKPKPPRRGRLGGAARLDLVATLRAAAPWQRMRQAPHGAPNRIVEIRASDIRLKVFEDRSDRLLIFVVDASGSAALARLAEAKGAVELLLAEAYARRDHVALIAFRGETADVLLPPTRSLVQTKRRLAGLPGGGGTPLAAGLEAAMSLAANTRSKGMTPTIALLTDGRANIALDGTPSRSTAQSDAQRMARLIRSHQTPALVIDTGNRPGRPLQDLADDLAATYVPLPRADAHMVSQAIEAALG